MITGKGKTLEYIAKGLPNIPVPEFIRVPSDTDAITAEKLAEDIGFPIIIRSDAICEDGLGKSFAGLFKSRKVTKQEYFKEYFRLVQENGLDIEESIMRQVKPLLEDPVKAYARVRKVNEPRGNIDVIIQKHTNPVLNAIITENPHAPDEVYIDLTWHMDLKFPNKHGIYTRKNDLDKALHGFLTLHGNDLERDSVLKFDERKFVEQMHQAIIDYDKISALPEFDNSIAYQEEACLLPYSVLQFRPFRKKEEAQFRLEKKTFNSHQDVFEIDRVFGITPAEGIRLKYFRTKSSMFAFDSEILAIHSTLSAAEISANIREEVCLELPDYRGWVPSMDSFSTLPKLTIIRADPEVQPWQAHEAFRLFERDGLFAISYLYMDYTPGQQIRYWSDGRKGRILIEK